MDSIILTIHSLNRWLIVIVGVLAAGKFLIGWLGNREYQSSLNEWLYRTT